MPYLRRAAAIPRQPEPARRIVSILLAVVLSVVLFAMFRPVHGMEATPMASYHGIAQP